MELIRKISIGNDLKDAMHYQVGTKTFNGVISDIVKNEDFFDVYTKNEDELSKWKSFNKSSVSHIEYDTKRNG